MRNRTSDLRICAPMLYQFFLISFLIYAYVMPCIVGCNQTALVQRDDQHTYIGPDADGHNIFHVKIFVVLRGFPGHNNPT